MLETDTPMIESEDSNLQVSNTSNNEVTKKEKHFEWLGFLTLVIGFIYFIWTYINIALPPRQSLPTMVYNDVTPIFSAKLSGSNVYYSLTANGIVYVLVSILFLALAITYFVLNRGFLGNLKQRLVHKPTYIVTVTFMSIVWAMWLIMFIMGFVPPRLSVFTQPENGTIETGNFTALFNWYTKAKITMNAGYWIVTVLFGLSLIMFVTSIIFYFSYAPINTQVEQQALLHQLKRDQKLAAQADQPVAEKAPKFSLREFFANAKQARKEAKAAKAQAATNSLRENLETVAVNNPDEVSVQPEIIEVDQHGSQTSEPISDSLPKIENDKLTDGVDKSEPRRLGKVIADMKAKKQNKTKTKGTNINKKATVAVPDQEINDLVKQLMPD